MGVRVEQKTRTKEPIDIPDDASLQLPCTNDSQQPLTVFVHHHVLRTKHTEFANWSKEINSIARTYDGFIDSEIIKPVTTSDDDNVNSRSDKQISDEYITIVRFQNYKLLKRWIDSEDRKAMLRRTKEFANAKSTYTYHSLEHWFPSNINGMKTTSTTADLQNHGPPPKWKMTIFVTIVIYLQTLWIPKVTTNVFPNATPNVKLYAIGLLNTLLIVLLVTYVLFPILTRLLAFWLFPHDTYSDKLKELVPTWTSRRKSERPLRPEPQV